MKTATESMFGVIILILCFGGITSAQTAYFIDGYHGGIYGHYPPGQTAFIVEQLEKHPDWNINVEIEPETWDIVKERDPDAYKKFAKIFADQTNKGRIEYINPTYGQGYLYNISGEGVIRQFEYGINHIKSHFPEAVFATYASEEPCFTSCLPMVLKSFGYTYASTKNPDTMWGGYTTAHGGELVNWIGPDGTSLLAVPRYECEDFLRGSTWQSIAWFNSKNYVEKCFAAGIKHPLGMTIQDAAWNQGWNKGPWLGNDTTKYYHPTEYKTFRDYIANISNGKTTDDFHFTQEDVLVSLMWGSQVLQKLAQETRVAENKIIASEKLAALSCIFAGTDYPNESLDQAWKNLLLAQHHDCWIVPYNRLPSRRTWAEEVSRWTGVTNTNCDEIIKNATKNLTKPGNNCIAIFNTTGFARNEIVQTPVPESLKRPFIIKDADGKQIGYQLNERDGAVFLEFKAKVPPLGYASFFVTEMEDAKKNEVQPTNHFLAIMQADGTVHFNTDLYSLIIDANMGGVIKSLTLKSSDTEFIDTKNERYFNELRGYFFKDEKFISSTDSPASVSFRKIGPVFATITINGKLGEHPFTQTLRFTKGEMRIDMSLKIDWQGNPGIGETNQQFRAEDRRKPFYGERYKLLLHFPVALKSQQVYKNAPFDVCESRHENTFFNRWDEIKHNIILNWIDIYGREENRGVTIFSDHTSSYAHGKDHPPALTVQYSGKGLWGRDYNITGPTEMKYSIIPHEGNWVQNRTWSEGERLNEPLIALFSGESPSQQKSLLSVEDEAFEVSSVKCKGNDIYVRFFNPHGDASNKTIAINVNAEKVELVELDGNVAEILPTRQTQNGIELKLSIPKFGIRTIKLVAASSQ